MKYKFIFLDLLNFFYRNKKAGKDKGIECNGIYNSLISLQKLEKDYLSETGVVYYLVDNPNTRIKMRKEIDPEYKMNRERLSKDFLIELNLLQNILLNRNDGYKLFQVPYLEADDLLPVVLNRYVDRKNDYCLLVSDDLDWSKEIDDSIHLLRKHKLLTKESFFEEFGIIPSKNKILMLKTFIGDESDCIPKGVPYLRTDVVHKIIEKYDNIYDFLKNFKNDSFLSDADKKHIEERKTRLILNYQLVDYISFEEDIENYCYDCKLNSNTYLLLLNSANIKRSDVDSREINRIKKERGLFEEMDIDRF